MLWWLLYFGGAVGTAVTVTLVLADYFKFDVVTRVRVKRINDGIDFPSVTLCNKNRVHCGRLLDMIVECEQGVI